MKQKIREWRDGIPGVLLFLILTITAAYAIDAWYRPATADLDPVIASWLYAIVVSLSFRHRGHGIPGRGHAKALGMPWPLAALYALILFGIIAVGHAPPGAPASVVASSSMVGLSSGIGWTFGLLYWYAIGHNLTLYYSEKKVRRGLEAEGRPQAYIDSQIELFRSKGFFGPPKT